MEKKIFVERETYVKDGKEYFAYFITGRVKNTDVKIGVVPHDVGGYTALDIVFDGAEKAELVLKPYEIKDEDTGRVISGNTYSAMTVDENGEIFECPIKPNRQSDKTILNMLIR